MRATPAPIRRARRPVVTLNTPFDHNAELAACARGERDALRRLYEREGRYLLGVALRLVRDRASAEDVLQDAFVAVWTRAGSFDPRRGDGRGWLYSIVRHAALDWVRAHRRTVSADEETLDALQEAGADPGPDVADTVAWRSSVRQLDACLERLDVAKRQCVLHAYLDGCSHAEIAERLNAPLGTVKAWIRRGLAALRECLA